MAREEEVGTSRQGIERSKAVRSESFSEDINGTSGDRVRLLPPKDVGFLQLICVRRRPVEVKHRNDRDGFPDALKR
jgi:hypothetical protein